MAEEEAKASNIWSRDDYISLRSGGREKADSFQYLVAQ